MSRRYRTHRYCTHCGDWQSRTGKPDERQQCTECGCVMRNGPHGKKKHKTHKRY